MLLSSDIFTKFIDQFCDLQNDPIMTLYCNYKPADRGKGRSQ